MTTLLIAGGVTRVGVLSSDDAKYYARQTRNFPVRGRKRTSPDAERPEITGFLANRAKVHGLRYEFATDIASKGLCQKLHKEELRS